MAPARLLGSRRWLLGALGALLAPLGIVTSAQAAAGNLAAAIPTPPGILAPSFQSISCLQAGACTAVGSYVASSHLVAMAATESHGRWARAVTIATPGTVSATLSSVSCVSAGECTAVGDYTTPDNYREPIAVSEVHGAWASPVRLATPPSSAQPPFELLRSISCTSAGECIAVGAYLNAQAKEVALAEVEHQGTWQPEVVVAPPKQAARSGSGVSATLVSVSCAASSDCTAVGNYTAADGAQEAMAISNRDGRWTTATAIAEPIGSAGSGELTAVSCPAVGSCTAVGEALNSAGSYGPAEVTEQDGRWERVRAVQVPPPISAAVPEGEFVAVSCVRGGTCATVGSFIDNNDNPRPLIAIKERGAWGPGFGSSVPRGGVSAGGALTGVSCLATGCTAIGNYVSASAAPRQMAVAIPA